MIHTIMSARTTMSVLTGLGLAAASFGLSRLSQDSSIWTLALVMIATLIGAGLVLRRVGVPHWAVLIVQLAAAIAILGAMAIPNTMAAGFIPTPSTFRAAFDLAPAGIDVMRDERAPLPASPGVRFLLLLLVAVSAIAADILAVGLAAPAAAGVAILLLYVVPLSALPTAGAWRTFAVTAIPFALMLVCGEARRRDSWMPARAHKSQGFDLAAIAAGLVVALIASLLLPSLIPRKNDQRFHLGSGRGTGSSVITVGNPMFDLGNSLRQLGKQPVLRYESSDQGEYRIRQAVVDTYDGTTFTPTTGKLARSQQVQKTMPGPPSAGPKASMDMSLIAKSSSTFLPSPQNPLSVEIEGRWLYDTSTLNMIGDGQVADAGLKYNVTFAPRTPDIKALRAAPRPQLPAEQLARWTEVPASVPAVVAKTAKEVAGEGSDYDKAARIQKYFREGNGFKYSLKVPDSTDGNALALFLKRRSGYCVHYSSTMALMARSLGIPARVVAGYLPGKSTAAGQLVTAEDAHAWPEIYFEGIGWVMFEPTAGGNVSRAPSYTQPDGAGGQTEEESPETEPTETPTDDSGTSVDDENAFKPTPTLGVQIPEPETSEPPKPSGVKIFGMSFPWAGIVVSILGILALAAAVLCLPWLRRRWTLNSLQGGANSDLDRIEAQWVQLREELADLGVRWPAAATLGDVEHGLVALLPEKAHGELRTLCEILDRGRYASATSPEDVTQAVSARQAIVAAAHEPLRASVSLPIKLFPTVCRRLRPAQQWPERATVSVPARR